MLNVTTPPNFDPDFGFVPRAFHIASINRPEFLGFGFPTPEEGVLEAPFSDLMEVLGEPDPGDTYKVTCRWVIEFVDGVIVQIDDFKLNDVYDPDNGVPHIFRNRWRLKANDPMGIDRAQIFLSRPSPN